ncbi:MAG: hypothetical protein HN617_16450 [Planctomycetaceae bacterium]|mgnify:FL=1|jgi:hypothetical protein|nr:hypothetical protein [Planctomycetaceae bacterium]MBT4012199.1 hypothetical protein [Planctomycetaceae bacterium]MBT4724611.1 hypothetical protein [Planctomycetaceae bacterium]MBT4847177.1 hypothetical protein [Planctomycetaceae bacterium]MBT5126201.1 hypothetical protein [Planctomycetaceae bacterium]
MTFTRIFFAGASATIYAVLAINVQAQDETRAIDVRSNKAIQAFVVEAMELAIEYEKNGDIEKARLMYQQIYRLDKRQQQLPAKIKFLEQFLLDKNQIVHKLNTAVGWTAIGRVYADRSFKLFTAGTFTMTPSGEFTASGMPEGDIKKNGMDHEMPLGALVGVYFNDKKPSKPFLVGAGKLFTPEKDGVLYLKINAPPAMKCQGVISVGTSGWFNLNAME